MDKIVYTTNPPLNVPWLWIPSERDIKYIGKFKKKSDVNIKRVDWFWDSIIILEKFFSEDECDNLIEFMNKSPNFEEVWVQWLKEWKDNRVWSLRTTVWTPKLSEMIWKKIKDYLPIIKSNKYTSTDWWQFLSEDEKEKWVTYVPVVVGPLHRFMKYSRNWEHYAHYDAWYIYEKNPNYRTLKSMVIYLTTNDWISTRFIKDSQINKPIWNRNHDDWNRRVRDNEVLFKSESIKWNVLIFDHRLCHDVEKYFWDDDRIIIRWDIVYKKV